MSDDAIFRALSKATVTLPYAEFHALLAGARDTKSDADGEHLVIREAGIKAAFLAMAAELCVEHYQGGDGETEAEAMHDEARNLLCAADLIDDDGEVLEGPAVRAMQTRLARLETVAVAAQGLVNTDASSSRLDSLSYLKRALADLQAGGAR